MSTLRVNNLTDTSGTAANLGIPGAAHAWVKFDGTGTVSIFGSYNVTALVDNGTGNYSVFFPALSSTNYATFTSGEHHAGVALGFAGHLSAHTTTAVQVISVNNSGTAYDNTLMTVVVFGD